MNATFSQEEWASSFNWNTNQQGLLRLRTDEMEHLCLFLFTQRDLLELALVNRACNAVVLPILWRKPSLPVPEKLPPFLRTVASQKHLALYVKRISLCVRDGDCPTVFQPVHDSMLKRHQEKIPLRWPKLIMHMVQQCENIETLKIYGWELTPMKIETIGATLKNLQSITIIGSNDHFQRPFVLRNLLSRLHELHLDGDFCISLDFANTLATRAQALRSLEIPLCYGDKRIEKQALTRLCSGKKGELDLTALKLTNASPMQDEDVENVLSAFPNLRSFTLHGTINVTAGIISTAIIKCENIESIELRAHSQTVLRQVQKPAMHNFPNTWVSASRLKRLLLEYMAIPEKVMEDLAQSSDSLMTIGLRNCLHVTDKALVQLIECNESLKTLHIVDCELITDETLNGLAKSSARKTIQDVYIEHCGQITPRAVYLFCCATTNYRLQHLCFDGYRNLSSSTLGTFIPPGEDTQSGGWESRVTLDERAIDALASMDTQLTPDLLDLPKDKTITGEQLVLLAKELNIGVDVLNSAIEKIQSECPEEGTDDIDSGSEQASVYAGFEQKIEHKTLSRVSSLRTQHNLRPTTPARWAHANESDIQQYLPLSTSMDDHDNHTVISTISRRSSRHSQRSSRHSQRHSLIDTPEPESTTGYESEHQAEPEEHRMDDDIDDRFEDFNEHSTSSSIVSADDRSPPLETDNDMELVDEPFTEQEITTQRDTMASSQVVTTTTTTTRPTVHENWPSLSTSNNIPSVNKKKTSEVELGGWGTNDMGPWTKKVQPSPKYSDSLPPIRRRENESWVPYTEERYGQQWQQQTLELTQPTFKSAGGRNSYSMESDGWGTPKSYVAWSDVRQQGFAREVLEQQRSTQFWDSQAQRYKSYDTSVSVKTWDDGVAKPSHQPQPVATSNDSTPSNSLNTSWLPIKNVNSTLQEQQQQQSKKIPENNKKFSQLRPRSPEILSSDDEDINWDDDDGVTIKTSPVLVPQHGRQPPLPASRGHSKSFSESTKSVKPPGRPIGDNVAQWNDFASVGVAEQVVIQDQRARQNDQAAASHQRQQQSITPVDTQSGFLIDTSDVISKSVISDTKLISTSFQPTSTSFDSSVWKAMSGLNMDNSIPTSTQSEQSQQASSPRDGASATTTTTTTSIHVQNNTKNMVDNTTDDLLSPTEETSTDMLSIQAPLTPRNNNTETSTIQQPLTPQVPESSKVNSPHTADIGVSDSLKSALFETSQTDASASDNSQAVSTSLSSESLSSPSGQSPSPKPETDQEPNADPRGPRLGSFKISIPEKGDCVLKIYMNVSPEDSAREFCNENGIPDMYDNVAALIKKAYDNLKTKKILETKGNKKKKSSKKKKQQ
ncbi:hypothetical protein BDC45DRAFT_502481 [Circinella umbellata]|nr:hypothetical protein BDC45DRAFT_502481 [Circinella umbellata]